MTTQNEPERYNARVNRYSVPRKYIITRAVNFCNYFMNKYTKKGAGTDDEV